LVDVVRGAFRILIACVVLSIALSGARRLHAQELGPTLLSYRAPDGCPGVADFRRSVQRRSARVSFVEQGAHDRELSITVRKEGDATHGELRLVERDGRASQRSVRFRTCAEALEGLALIAVMSLDPQALLEPEKPPPDATPAAVVPAPKPPAPTAKPPPKPAAAPERPAATQPSTTKVGLGAAFNVAPSALPATALGGSLFADLTLPSQSHFAPLFRLALSHVERRGLSSTDGAQANFTLTLATLSACPVRLSAGILELRPCGFGSAGVLYAWGSQTTNLQQRTRPYGALGGSLALFLSVSQTIDIVADLAAGATLLRDSFGFEQDQAWRTPALYLSSGIGARFVFR